MESWLSKSEMLDEESKHFFVSINIKKDCQIRKNLAVVLFLILNKMV